NCRYGSLWRAESLRRRTCAGVGPLENPEELKRFERIVMPHLSAGYSLARWLTRNEHDAEDVVQEAYVRAVRSFDRYRGGDARAWILTIVRNTCYTWLRQNRAESTLAGGVDDGTADLPADPANEPEAQLMRGVAAESLRDALQALPAEFREALVLRELEG